jgi:quercetin dioxygenase-like cupin family protein
MEKRRTAMDASEAISTQEPIRKSSRLERRRMAILAGYMEWILTPAETSWHSCMLETFIPPGAGVPPHQHMDQEAFYILEGALEVASLGPRGSSGSP